MPCGLLDTIEERNNSSNNKSKNPYSEKNSNPYAPSHQSMAVSMFAPPKNSEVQKAGNDRCIQHAEHDDSGYSKSIGNLLVNWFKSTVRRTFSLTIVEVRQLPVVYCPSLEYITPPASVKTINSLMVTARRTLGNSRGSRISAMNEGRVICPLTVNRENKLNLHESVSDVEHGAHTADKVCARGCQSA